MLVSWERGALLLVFVLSTHTSNDIIKKGLGQFPLYVSLFSCMLIHWIIRFHFSMKILTYFFRNCFSYFVFFCKYIFYMLKYAFAQSMICIDNLKIHCSVGLGCYCQQCGALKTNTLLPAICGGKFISPIFDFINLDSFFLKLSKLLCNIFVSTLKHSVNKISSFKY